jgi:hypothetical protein
MAKDKRASEATASSDQPLGESASSGQPASADVATLDTRPGETSSPGGGFVVDEVERRRRHEDALLEDASVPLFYRGCVALGLDPDAVLVYRKLGSGKVQYELDGGVTITRPIDALRPPAATAKRDE